jgi:amino acid permease
VNIIFSYVGMDIVAATAAESKELANAESMKMAARKISLRIIILYCLAVLVGSFMVPDNHPFINGGGQSVGSHSIFIIAVVEAGIPAAAHFFNAIFTFSSFTCAINSMYVASRVLHTLALRDQTGPEFSEFLAPALPWPPVLIRKLLRFTLSSHLSPSPVSIRNSRQSSPCNGCNDAHFIYGTKRNSGSGKERLPSNPDLY